MEKQAVKIGVDRLFIAEVLTDDSTSTTYATPELIPGTTEISLTTNNNIETFYADDGPYENYQQQGDIELKMVLAGLSLQTYSKVTGATYDNTTGLMKDGKADSPSDFAVGFRTQKSNGKYQYCWLYKGKFNKPDSSNTTKSDSVTVSTEEYTYKAVARLSDGYWRQKLDSDDLNLPEGITDQVLNNEIDGWFSSPDYTPIVEEEVIDDTEEETEEEE